MREVPQVSTKPHTANAVQEVSSLWFAIKWVFDNNQTEKYRMCFCHRTDNVSEKKDKEKGHKPGNAGMQGDRLINEQLRNSIPQLTHASRLRHNTEICVWEHRRGVKIQHVL